MLLGRMRRRELLKAVSAPLLLALAGCGPSVLGRGVRDRWREADAIRRRIQRPVIPNRDFVITDFGAAPDGVTDNGPFIKQAIMAAKAAGGGRVVVPAGEFATGPVHLESHVDLHLMDGARLAFIPDPALYLPPVFTRWEGVELMGYSPLIYAYGKTDVAITGDGVIDGGASDDKWWPWSGKWPDVPHTQAPARQKLFQDAEAGVPPEQRVYADGAYLRPPCVQFYKCDRVLIDGVTIRNSPCWCTNPVLCRSVTVRNMTADSAGPNSDGCNPESCEDVLIEGCLFNTGDDCIAIKSGRNADGRRLHTPSRNIVIADCQMKDGHGGVVMGSELSGGVENIFVENCRMDSPHLERGVRIKTNAQRGGFVRNVNVRNIDIGFVSEMLVINFFYEEGDDGPYEPDVRNIVLEAVTCRETARVLNIQGFEHAKIRNVDLHQIDIGSMQDKSIIRNIENLVLSDVFVSGELISDASQLT